MKIKQGSMMTMRVEIKMSSVQLKKVNKQIRKEHDNTRWFKNVKERAEQQG